SPSPLFPRRSSSWKMRSAFDSWTAAGAASCRRHTVLRLAKRSGAVFNDPRQGGQDIDFLSRPTKGEIRIGTTEPIATAIVLPAIDRLSRKYPQMSFHVVAGVRRRCTQMPANEILSLRFVG